MANTYSEKSIKSFQGLSGIRQRAAIYVGNPDSNALFILAKEVLDNTLDEFLAGRNKECHIYIDKGTVTVADYGPGIPTGNIKIQEADGRYTTLCALDAIVSRTHTGGKFDGESGAYDEGSIGTNGVGIKATNALSSSFEVWTTSEKGVWYTKYEKGVCKVPAEKCSGFPKLETTVRAKLGTVIRYTPDLTIFQKGSTLAVNDVLAWADLASHLNSGFKITVSLPTYKEPKVFINKDGAASYVQSLIEKLNATTLAEKFLVIQTKNVSIALGFTDYDGIHLVGYTNGTLNALGGVHVDATLKLLASKIIDVVPSKGTPKFRAPDLYEGLVGVVNVKLSSPSFNTQTKEKLVDKRVDALIQKEVTPLLDKWISSNKALAKTLCTRATDLRALKDDFKAHKDASRKLTSKRGNNPLPQKLLVSKCSTSERVIYLVEGDSASGSCKRARDPRYQEVLPLRGKLMNAYKVPRGKRIWDSDEVMAVLQAIGYDPTAKSPGASLRVGKIMLLGDADVDGSHVNLLNISLLATLVPQVFTNNMVYAVKGYEYVIQTDDAFYCGDSVAELRQKAPAKLHSRISHIKGWGELDWPALKYMAFDSKTAKFERIVLDKKGFPTLKTLMGEDVGARKELLGLD